MSTYPYHLLLATTPRPENKETPETMSTPKMTERESLTLAHLVRATRRAYNRLAGGDIDGAQVYADHVALFAEHGLDANTAESSIDWLDGGPGLLVESLADAIARRNQ